jgi:hypothetical protein
LNTAGRFGSIRLLFALWQPGLAQAFDNRLQLAHIGRIVRLLVGVSRAVARRRGSADNFARAVVPRREQAELVARDLWGYLDARDAQRRSSRRSSDR